MAINKVIKEIKSSESLISMVLGIVVVIVVGVLLFNYFKSTVNKGKQRLKKRKFKRSKPLLLSKQKQKKKDHPARFLKNTLSKKKTAFGKSASNFMETVLTG